MNFKDRVAIITGGARGIGMAVAEAYVKRDAKVVICSRSVDELENAVKKLQKHGEVRGIRTDVSRREDVAALVDEVLGSYKAVDVLINAAGVQGPIGPLVVADIHDWLDCISINLVGTVLCCRAVLTNMMQKRKGKIINFSGGGATSPRPNFTAYACSKTAVVRFTETLAREVKDYGINVNAIAPGPVNTRMLREIAKAGDKAGKKESSDVQKIIAQGGTPPELAAQLAVFLASQESDGITGRLISAVWDNWQDKDFAEKLHNNPSLYTLRRIDGRNFVEGKA